MFKVLFSLLFFINFLNSNQQRGGKQGISIETNKQDTIFKKVKFGFNIGYLGDLQTQNLFDKPLKQIEEDCILNLRIYEPFTKNIIQHPDLVGKLLTPLVQSGFKLLISLSNFPVDSDYTTKSNYKENEELLKFTNRYAPANLSDYDIFLENFLNDLQRKDLLSSISFEIGNEPDARKYFWSSPEDFIKTAQSIKAVLLKYHQSIYCCAFTSEFANRDKQESKKYLDLLKDAVFFKDVNLSFHFYPNNKYTVNTLSLPFSDNAIISEFNLFSYQTQKTTGKINYTNSSEFASSLIELLQYAYEKNIKEIYFFNLVDNPKKEASLGFFDANGNSKASYQYLMKVYSVVKDGYKMEKTNQYIKIIGKKKSIIYALNNNMQVSLPANQKILDVYSNDMQLFNPVLKKKQWIIIGN